MSKKYEVGKVFPTNNDGDVEIIEVVTPSRIFMVKFLNTGNVKRVHCSVLGAGQVKDTEHSKFLKDYELAYNINENRYTPSVMGVGFIGYGKYNTKSFGRRLYCAWRAMFERCYSQDLHERCPTYIGCSVCTRWHNFQNFAEDFQKLDGFDLWLKNENRESLDKDTKIKGNKVYSPETCCIISSSENAKAAMDDLWGEREYYVEDPKGNRYIVHNLRGFCTEHNLVYPNMWNVCNKTPGYVSCKGYKTFTPYP